MTGCRIQSEASHQLNLPEGLTVGFTGHIYPGRGADLLFELAKQMPQVNFLWVGGTPELVDFWRAKLTDAKMTNVTMTGFVKHESHPALSSRVGCAADAVQPLDLCQQRTGYRRGHQPDEDVRVHGFGAGDCFGGFAFDPRGVE